MIKSLDYFGNSCGFVCYVDYKKLFVVSITRLLRNRNALGADVRCACIVKKGKREFGGRPPTITCVGNDQEKLFILSDRDIKSFDFFYGVVM